MAPTQRIPALGNRLLDTLPLAERERLSPDLDPVVLTQGQLLLEPEDPLDFVYFPTDGMLSMLTVLEDGEAIEAATIGVEGMAGAQVFLGASSSAWRLVVQIDSRAQRVPSEAFRYHLGHSEQLRMVVTRYLDVLFLLFAQSAACNRMHHVNQRCARWLLDTHDRAPGDTLSLTQEFLSQMLGVRRASVSEAAAALQAAGLIQYRHGKITVVDRAGLESAACECYRVIRRRFDRMWQGS